MEIDMLNSAIDYASKGLKVHPVKPHGKRAISKFGCKDATTDYDQIETWWSRTPDANIGMLCGDKFFVLDVDVSGDKKGLDSLKQLDLPETLTSKTGSGGYHYFFKMPRGKIIKNKVGFLPGLDIRSTGGYVVVPPSIHENGKRYKWRNELPIAEAPKCLLDLIVTKKAAPWERQNIVPKPVPQEAQTMTSKSTIERASLYLKKCEPAIQGSGGHNALLVACNAMVNGFSLSDTDALSLLWNEYNPRCSPPWDRSNPSDVKDFERKIIEAKKGNNKPVGWLLESKEDNIEANEALRLQGELISQKIIARHNEKAGKKKTLKGDFISKVIINPWDDVKEDDVRRAIKGTALEVLVKDMESVTVPKLPLTISLPKALVIAGALLSSKKKQTAYAVSTPVLTESADDVIKVNASPIERAKLYIDTAGGQVCNVYALIVAESGTGKDIGGRVDSLLGSVELLLGDSGSAEGIADSLIEKPNGVLAISEFMNWLDHKHWQSKAASFLTSAFNKGRFNVALSKRKGETGRKSDYCFPSIIANVQPAVMARNADMNVLESGFLQRFLITRVKSSRHRPRSNVDKIYAENSKKVLKCFHVKEGVVSCPDKYLDEIHETMFRTKAPYRGHWERLINEYGPRFAVMLSIAHDDYCKEVVLTRDCWDRAEILIKWFFKQALGVARSINEDEQERKSESKLRKMHLAIAKYGDAGVSKTRLSRYHALGLKAPQRDELYDELRTRGLIEFNDGKYRSIDNEFSEDVIEI